MNPEESELVVTLVSGRTFVVAPHGGRDANQQAHALLQNGATEIHGEERWTLHPPARIASVTVQPRGTHRKGIDLAPDALG